MGRLYLLLTEASRQLVKSYGTINYSSGIEITDGYLSITVVIDEQADKDLIVGVPLGLHNTDGFNP